MVTALAAVSSVSSSAYATRDATSTATYKHSEPRYEANSRRKASFGVLATVHVVRAADPVLVGREDRSIAPL